MSSLKMAYKLLKDNFKMYALYLLVLTVSVAIYYNFVAIKNNKSFIELTKRINSTMVASNTCGFVLICTVVFFMWYANNFFFKQRQKETALYMLMGISPSKIGKVFAIESIFLSGVSFVIGLPIGILFSKLFFMLLGKSMALEEELIVDISIKSVVELIIVFGIIFLILGIKNYRIIKKSELIDMINATKKKSEVPKLNFRNGIIGVILIIIGYILGLMIKRWQLDLIIDSMAALILVCVGTYLFFKSFLPIILNAIIKQKKIIYKNSRLVSISNIFFRLKENYSNFAMTAILVATTVTVFSTSVAFKQCATEDAAIESPYSFSYENKDENINNKVMELIEGSSHKLIGINQINLCMYNINYQHMDKVDYNNHAILISYSEVEKTLKFLNYKNINKTLDKIKPTKDKITFVLNANSISSPFIVNGENVMIDGKKYSINNETKIPLLGKSKVLGARNVYILDDDTYKNIAKKTNEVVLNGIKITDEKNSDKLVSNIMQVINGGQDKVNPYVKQYVWEYYALGTFSFLGFVMSIIFMLATFSAFYFKILSDAFVDKEQYSILKKVGMSKEEAQNSVYTQVAIAFILPTIIGVIHSVIAVKMIEQIMDDSFFLQLVFGIVMFLIVMIIFYMKLSSKYIKLVYDRG